MTESIWKAKSRGKDYDPLTEDLEVDVAIVGGGITGMTSAYLLSRSGMKVAVVEARKIAGGTTGNSTGNLYAMVDQRLHHIQSKWDKKTARMVAESRKAAVNLVEELVEQWDISCGFQRVPWYLFSETSKKDKIIEKEKNAIADYGLKAELIEDLPLPFPVSQALIVADQAQFNPAAFVRGLAEKVDSERCRIFENSPVVNIEKGEVQVLHLPSGKIRAHKTILATHTPKGIYGLHTAVYPHREYAMAFSLKNGVYPKGIFWDTETENHQSIRSYEYQGEQFLLVVGQHHKVGQEDPSMDYFAALETNARKYFDIASVAFKWSAQHYKPADGLPFIGESADDYIYVATGFATDGLTYGVLSAMLFRDLFTGKENPWADLYKARRFTPVKSAGAFVKENLNVLGEYLKDLPVSKEEEFFADIKAGEGRVLGRKNEKLAVYRNKEGKLHACSAVCTHMECIVHWNQNEESWDCPCHGSRFTPTGKVIEGPALSPLEKKSLNR